MLLMRTKRLTFAAILTALSVVLLLGASVVPTGRLALIAIASLLPAAGVMQCGLLWGVAVYLATGVLGLLLLPMKGCAVLYCLVLGHYGVLKSLIERIGRLPVEWICKLLLYSTVLTALYFLFRWALILPEQLERFAFPVLLLGGNVVYAVYDYVYTKLILFYQQRIQHKIGTF